MCGDVRVAGHFARYAHISAHCQKRLANKTATQQIVGQSRKMNRRNLARGVASYHNAYLGS